mgnify:CR=1 FL=1
MLTEDVICSNILLFSNYKGLKNERVKRMAEDNSAIKRV